MPTYPYECELCGYEQTIFKKMSNFDRTEICPHCSNEMLRIPTAVAFVGGEDSFRNATGGNFFDDVNKKEIKNFKDWEQAGYRDPRDLPSKSSDVKSRIKQKMNERNKQGVKVKER